MFVYLFIGTSGLFKKIDRQETVNTFCKGHRPGPEPVTVGPRALDMGGSFYLCITATSRICLGLIKNSITG